MQKNKPKIVFLDIETLMIPKETLKRIPSYGAYPGRGFNGTVSSVLCFGYKIKGEKDAKIINAWDFSTFKKDVNDDSQVCKAIWEVLKDTDAIVTQNGKRFDVPVINTRMAKHGLPAIPKTIKHLDTKNVFKANYSAYDNKLDTIADTFGCELKMENGGWDLWMSMYNRDKKAMKLMSEYCKQDVRVTEQVFIKMLPVMKGLPNYNLFTDDNKRVCPSCGSSKLHIKDTRRLNGGLFQRYSCQDCGSVSRDTKPIEKRKVGLVQDA
jgi:DNA polymerase elongation subunit (family B)